MKFMCLPEHKEFYATKGFIQFEEIISTAKANELAKASDDIISKREKARKFEKSQSTPELQKYALGRNLWMDHPSFKSLAYSKKVHGLVTELHNVKSLRLAFDQLLVGSNSSNPLKANLIESFCVDPILCALIICIKPSDEKQNEDSPWPNSLATGLIVNPEMELPSPPVNGLFLILLFCQDAAQYYYNEGDFNTQFLKHLGLTFGNTLKGEMFPKISKI
jgi:hypothetical protein